MATSDCSFCARSDAQCVLRHGTAAICVTCADLFGSELGFVSQRPTTGAARERWDRALAAARIQAAGREPHAGCSFCGSGRGRVAAGRVRMRGETDLVLVLGDPIYICLSCVERAVAATKAS